jgi:hypothetical protein
LNTFGSSLCSRLNGGGVTCSPAGGTEQVTPSPQVPGPPSPCARGWGNLLHPLRVPRPWRDAS